MTEPARAGLELLEVTDGTTTGDGVIHDLTAAASTDRPHRIEQECWCEPEIIDQDGEVYAVHHSMQDVLAAHADAPGPR